MGNIGKAFGTIQTSDKKRRESKKAGCENSQPARNDSGKVFFPENFAYFNSMSFLTLWKSWA